MMLWSAVSNAAERSRRQIHDIFDTIPVSDRQTDERMNRNDIANTACSIVASCKNSISMQTILRIIREYLVKNYSVVSEKLITVFF